MKEPGITFYEVPLTYWGSITRQMLYNEYFYETMEDINAYLVQWNKTYEWKLQQIDRLVSLVGYPIKLTRWQKFLANFLTL